MNGLWKINMYLMQERLPREMMHGFPDCFVCYSNEYVLLFNKSSAVNFLMITYFPLAVLAFFACLGLAAVGRRLHLTDKPSGRKQHVGDIPLVGGLAIFGVFAVAQSAASASNKTLTLAMALIVILGMVDDKIDLPPLLKLVGQISISLFVCIESETVIHSLGTLPGGNELLLGPLALPLTAIAIVGLINAINMIDGLDGLAAGLTMLALIHLVLAMHLIGKPLEDPALFEISVMLVGLAVFMCFNFGLIPKRKIFLGDAGSMMLGLFAAFQLINASQRAPLTDTLPTSLVPWMVALPIVDTIRLIFIRISSGRSPLSPDRLHLHHILLDSGLSTHQAFIAMMIAAAGLFWTGFFLGELNSVLAGGMFIALTTAGPKLIDAALLLIPKLNKSKGA